MNVWRSETTLLSPAEKKVENLFYFLLDHNVPGIGQHVGKTLNLHRFLQIHRREPDLWRRVLAQGKPIFTKAQLARFFRTQKTQNGGGFSAGTDFFDKIINRFAAKLGSFASDKSTAASADKSMAAFSSCLFSFPSLPGVKPAFDFMSLILFMPWHAEQIPVVGPMIISPALDSATLGIPASAEFVESGIKLLTFVPVVGTFANVGAIVIQTILMGITTILNLGRAQYGSAFQTALGMVPQFGDALVETAQQLEKALERIQTRLDRAIAPIREFTPTGAAAAQQYIPSMEEYTGPPVPLTKETIDTIKTELFSYLDKKAKQDSRFQQLQSLLQTVTAQISVVVPPRVMELIKTNDIKGALMELKNIVLPPQLLDSVGKVKELITNLSSGPMGQLPQLPQLPQLAAATNATATNAAATNATATNAAAINAAATNATATNAAATNARTNATNVNSLTKRNNRTSFGPQPVRKRKTRRYPRR
jgi:hypothetical protein